jgi:hypothetical protein
VHVSFFRDDPNIRRSSEITWKQAIRYRIWGMTVGYFVPYVSLTESPLIG